MRIFVAVRPPEEVVEELDDFLESRRNAAPFRWTPVEQWHLTLAFAANVPDRAYDEMVDHLAAAAARRLPVEARIAGGGAFPHVERAKVLYAGVRTDTDELGRLATGARYALGTAGVDVDGRHFRPHLTLARLGRPVEATNWVRVLDTFVGGPWRVEEIALVSAHLGEGPRRSPRHEVLETFRLGPAGNGPAPPDARAGGR